MNAQIATRKLFLSFTSLIRLFRDGRVSESDLDNALFYFGCVREHAMDPWKDETNEVLWAYKDEQQGRAAHTLIAAALKKAESEGRVGFKNMGDQDNDRYRKLNDLLRANDLTPIEPREKFLDGDKQIELFGGYTYPAVIDKIKKQGLPIEGIWR
jgi:hypothetical protein